jgi:hypothetical protein
MATWPGRHASLIKEMARILPSSGRLEIVNYGPGVMHKGFVPLVPKGEKASKGPLVRSWGRAIRLVESTARRRMETPEGLVTFEPFEIAQAMGEEKKDFRLTVIDKKSHVQTVMENSPSYPLHRKNIRFINAGIETLSTPAHGIVALAVIGYADRKKAVANMAKALETGGVLATDHLTEKEMAEHGLKLHRKYADGALYVKQ